ncbi:MAG: hypothetical protein MJ095_00105 [Oscillospiraceae bacterium]|nr:hypothetical protein [Oscillospiraceae bacterium]
MNTKIRLLQLNMKQTDLLRLLERKGVITDAPELSRAISGCSQERYKRIMAAVDEILTEKEQSNGLQESAV